MAADEVCVSIDSDADLVVARGQARALAQALGFSKTDSTLIATAVSEITRNIIIHVGAGRIEMTPLYDEKRYGLRVIAIDSGPGILDADLALEDGHAGRGGLGLGLPGVRRLMDEFAVDTTLDSGTTITMTKWRVRDELERLRERRVKAS
jgi:serine/threonine-protein kinase RsbT